MHKNDLLGVVVGRVTWNWQHVAKMFDMSQCDTDKWINEGQKTIKL